MAPRGCNASPEETGGSMWFCKPAQYNSGSSQFSECLSEIQGEDQLRKTLATTHRHTHVHTNTMQHTRKCMFIHTHTQVH